MIHCDDADLWRLAGDRSMDTSSLKSKALVRMKFGTSEVEPSKFSSKVNGKSYDWPGLAVQLCGQYVCYLINSKQSDWNITMKENDLH